ncbi:MAG: hypothetical protein ACOZIN_09805 [Myxococcota bacterium]
MRIERLLFLAWLVASSHSIGAPRVEPKEKVDIAAMKEKLKVLEDGKGHVIVVEPFGASGALFWGDGKTMYEQRVLGGGAVGEESFSRNFWEPRVERRAQAELSFREGKYTVDCESRQTEFKPAAENRAAEVLDRAVFLKPRWKRIAYALARDNAGNYYYVDRARETERVEDFRLFIGPRGRLKQQQMVNIVSDSAGDIFASKKGELRLVLDRKESLWISGKKTLTLTALPVEDNVKLIYTGLGVYEREKLGTPCDEL